MYGKLTESGIEYAPLNKGNVLNFGTKANEEQLLELGYLPVVREPPPIVGENQILIPCNRLGDGVIIAGHELLDLPTNPLQRQIDDVRDTAEDTKDTLNAFLEGFGGVDGE